MLNRSKWAWKWHTCSRPLSAYSFHPPQLCSPDACILFQKWRWRCNSDRGARRASSLKGSISRKIFRRISRLPACFAGALLSLAACAPLPSSPLVFIVLPRCSAFCRHFSMFAHGNKTRPNKATVLLIG